MHFGWCDHPKRTLDVEDKGARVSRQTRRPRMTTYLANQRRPNARVQRPPEDGKPVKPRASPRTRGIHAWPESASSFPPTIVETVCVGGKAAPLVVAVFVDSGYDVC